MTPRVLYRVCFILTLSWGIFALPISRVCGGEITLQSVIACWQGRENEVKTCKFACEEKFTVPKGSFRLGTTSPPKDTTYRCNFNGAISGNKLRYERTRPAISSNQEVVPRQTTVTVSNGSLNKRHDLPGTTHYHLGWVGGEPLNPDDRTNPALFPLVVQYRPFGICGLQDRMRSATIDPRKTPIQGIDCIAVRCGHYLFWVDPARRCLIVRYAEIVGNRIIRQVDYSNFRQAKDAWVLSGWRDTLMRKEGTLGESSDVQVVSCILNEPVADSQFDLDFSTRDIRDRPAQAALGVSDPSRRHEANHHQRRPRRILRRAGGVGVWDGEVGASKTPQSYLQVAPCRLCDAHCPGLCCPVASPQACPVSTLASGRRLSCVGRNQREACG